MTKEEQKQKLIEMMREDEKNGIYMTKSERLRGIAVQISNKSARQKSVGHENAAIVRHEMLNNWSEEIKSLADTLDSLEISDEQIEMASEKYARLYDRDKRAWAAMDYRKGMEGYREQMRNKLK